MRLCVRCFLRDVRRARAFGRPSGRARFREVEWRPDAAPEPDVPGRCVSDWSGDPPALSRGGADLGVPRRRYIDLRPQLGHRLELSSCRGRRAKLRDEFLPDTATVRLRRADGNDRVRRRGIHAATARLDLAGGHRGSDRGSFVWRTHERRRRHPPQERLRTAIQLSHAPRPIRGPSSRCRRFMSSRTTPTPSSPPIGRARRRLRAPTSDRAG